MRWLLSIVALLLFLAMVYGVLYVKTYDAKRAVDKGWNVDPASAVGDGEAWHYRLERVLDK